MVSNKVIGILGPILFTFFIAAVMIDRKASCNIRVSTFRSRVDATLTGQRFRLMVNHSPFYYMTIYTLTTQL